MLLGYFGKTPCEPDPELIKWAEEKLTAIERDKAKKGIEEKIKTENPNISEEQFTELVSSELEKIKVLPTTEKVVDINEKDPEKGIAAATERLKAAGLPITDENLFIACACKDGNVDKGIDFLLGKGQVSVNKVKADAQKTAASANASGEYTVKVNGKAYAVKLDGDNKATVNGKAYDIDVKAGIESKASSSSGGGEEIKAGLPGNVLRIEVSEGDTVAEGDVLLVVEAMKMETEVKSPKAGTVNSILVSQGDKVVTGQPMVVIG